MVRSVITADETDTTLSSVEVVSGEVDQTSQNSTITVESIHSVEKVDTYLQCIKCSPKDIASNGASDTL